MVNRKISDINLKGNKNINKPKTTNALDKFEVVCYCFVYSVHA